jgi:hypothetical protein
MSTTFFVLKCNTATLREPGSFCTIVNMNRKCKLGDAPRCPACKRFIGMRKWMSPYYAEIEIVGSQYGDFAFGGFEWFLVSERFRMLYLDSEMVGLSGFDHVTIQRITRNNKSGCSNASARFYKVDVLRSRAAIDLAASRIEWSEPAPICSECLFQYTGVCKRWKAVVVRPETWRGEDIFVPRGTGEIVVTSRFKEFCEAHDIRNASFVEASKYGHDFNPWENSP